MKERKNCSSDAIEYGVGVDNADTIINLAHYDLSLSPSAFSTILTLCIQYHSYSAYLSLAKQNTPAAVIELLTSVEIQDQPPWHSGGFSCNSFTPTPIKHFSDNLKPTNIIPVIILSPPSPFH